MNSVVPTGSYTTRDVVPVEFRDVDMVVRKDAIRDGHMSSDSVLIAVSQTLDALKWGDQSARGLHVTGISRRLGKNGSYTDVVVDLTETPLHRVEVSYHCRAVNFEFFDADRMLHREALVVASDAEMRHVERMVDAVLAEHPAFHLQSLPRPTIKLEWPGDRRRPAYSRPEGSSSSSSPRGSSPRGSSPRGSTVGFLDSSTESGRASPLVSDRTACTSGTWCFGSTVVQRDITDVVRVLVQFPGPVGGVPPRGVQVHDVEGQRADARLDGLWSEACARCDDWAAVQRAMRKTVAEAHVARIYYHAGSEWAWMDEAIFAAAPSAVLQSLRDAESVVVNYRLPIACLCGRKIRGADSNCPSCKMHRRESVGRQGGCRKDGSRRVCEGVERTTTAFVSVTRPYV
jgi:hypothetical protein